MNANDWTILRDYYVKEWQNVCSPETANAAYLKGQINRSCGVLLEVIRGKIIKTKGSLDRWDFLEVAASMTELRRRGHRLTEFDQWLITFRMTELDKGSDVGGGVVILKELQR